VKLRRILRRKKSRPPAFPNETAIVRFLSPPLLHAGRAIHGPCRLFFFRGILPRVSFDHWRCRAKAGGELKKKR